MRYIITGATGFIGQKIIEKLLEKNNEIIAIIRPNSKKTLRSMPNPNLKIIQCDFRNIKDLQDKLKNETNTVQIDHFIHLAWNGTTGEERSNAQIQLENVKNSLECFRIAEQLQCQTFFFAGSQAEYGNIEKHNYSEQKEDNVCYPENEYGKNKLAFGQKIMTLKTNMKVYHARIFSVYGPNDQEKSLIQTMIKTLNEGNKMLLGPCEHDWNFTYIDDIANLIISLIHSSSPSGIYNLASNDIKPLKEYIKQIQQARNWQGECIINGRPSTTTDIPLRPNLSKINSCVKNTSISFEEGIEKTINYTLEKKLK